MRRPFPESHEQRARLESEANEDQILTQEIMTMLRTHLSHLSRQETRAYIHSIMNILQSELGEERLRGLSRVDFLHYLKEALSRRLEAKRLKEEFDAQQQLAKAFSDVYREVELPRDASIPNDFVDGVINEIMQKIDLGHPEKDDKPN